MMLKSDKNETIAYFLRCLWHIINDPGTDSAIHWHPQRTDAFIIADATFLEQTLLTYKPFKTSFNTLRRSLYFYEFKQRKNIWSHDRLDKNNRNRKAEAKIRTND